MGNPKPKGYGKAGRPSYREVKTLKDAKAILESNTLADAYLKTHPKSSRRSAVMNSSRMMTPEVLEKVKQLLQLDKLGETNKMLLEKVLHIVIARWLSGAESTKDMLTAVGILSKLVPDFKDRQLIEDLSKKDPKEIDRELREKYGIIFGEENNNASAS